LRLCKPEHSSVAQKVFLRAKAENRKGEKGKRVNKRNGVKKTKEAAHRAKAPKKAQQKNFLGGFFPPPTAAERVKNGRSAKRGGKGD